MRSAGPTGAIEQYSLSNNPGTSYDVLPDGERFAMIRGLAPTEIREIVIVQNGFGEGRGVARAE